MFFRKKYPKLPEGKTWTKNTLLKRMLDEASAKDFKIKTELSNTLWEINKNKQLYLLFNTANYSEKNELNLIGTFVFRSDKDEVVWDDIFNISQKYYGDDKYRALEIYRNQDFDGSKIKKEMNDLILPLISKLQDSTFVDSAINGKVLKISNKTINLINISKELWSLN